MIVMFLIRKHLKVVENVENIKEVGIQIRKIREEKKMTLEELGNKINKTKSYVSKLERGVKPISLQNLQMIAEALGIDVTDLFPNKEKVDNPFTGEEDWAFVVRELKDRGYSAGDVYLRLAQEAIEKDKKK
jgi:transcriptional regulator with XRE-family HTH domain